MSNPRSPLLKRSDYENAPEDDQSAFLYLEETARQRMYEAFDEDQNGNVYYPLRDEYMTRVSGLAQTFDVPGVEFDPDYNNFDNEFHRFINAVDYQTTQLNALQSKAARRTAIRIAAADRTKIQHHLGIVREAIEKSELSKKRRNAILKRLDEIEAELAKAKSNMGIILVGITVVVGFASDIDQLTDTIQRASSAIVKTLGQIRCAEDEKVIEHSTPTPQRIEAPNRLIQNKSQNSKSFGLDEDVPF